MTGILGSCRSADWWMRLARSAEHIYAKLNVGDRAAAVAEAFNRGLLTPGTPERP